MPPARKLREQQAWPGRQSGKLALACIPPWYDRRTVTRGPIRPNQEVTQRGAWSRLADFFLEHHRLSVTSNNRIPNGGQRHSPATILSLICIERRLRPS